MGINSEIEAAADSVVDHLEACVRAAPASLGVTVAVSEAMGHLVNVLINLTQLEDEGAPRDSRDTQRGQVYLLHRELVALGSSEDERVRHHASRAAMGVTLLTSRLRELQGGFMGEDAEECV